MIIIMDGSCIEQIFPSRKLSALIFIHVGFSDLYQLEMIFFQLFELAEYSVDGLFVVVFLVGFFAFCACVCVCVHGFLTVCSCSFCMLMSFLVLISFPNGQNTKTT